MASKCLVATSFDGVEEQLNQLSTVFDCIYSPDVILPCQGFEDVTIIIVNPNNLRWRLDRSTLDCLSGLKTVLTISTGIAHIDLPYLRERSIELISLKDNTKDMGSITATAELAFLFFMSQARNFNFSSNRQVVQRWDWRECG